MLRNTLRAQRRETDVDAELHPVLPASWWESWRDASKSSIGPWNFIFDPVVDFYEKGTDVRAFPVTEWAKYAEENDVSIECAKKLISESVLKRAYDALVKVIGPMEGKVDMNWSNFLSIKMSRNNSRLMKIWFKCLFPHIPVGQTRIWISEYNRELEMKDIPPFIQTRTYGALSHKDAVIILKTCLFVRVIQTEIVTLNHSLVISENDKRRAFQPWRDMGHVDGFEKIDELVNWQWC